ncbi:isocitrate dehydrogenase (NAD+) [Fonticula alba]|uniref:Isocitrate dehydrogenase (NAD+) n=1 Tax=Fonticula alba TaxID=691883 RepID=A0A058Z1G3_FONAL|nr:isocitrate dehydrogenase (NAD+) [Fonticula alba]KCV68114.1 isocitrate dehydrogenase (NAD+) [Fonticula alba]|eukprot:XP_009497488.1 isocitrate dehydrogenase (NAD+) [Fonticula alba]
MRANGRARFYSTPTSTTQEEEPNVIATAGSDVFTPTTGKAPSINRNFNTTKYGGRHTVTLIPGDGIGRELTDSVRAIFKAAEVPVVFDIVDLVPDETGNVDISEAVQSLRRNKVGLKGVLFTPILRTGSQSFNLQIRKELDLYANLVICKSIPGFPARHKDVDIVIIRENTEGEYSGLEHEPFPGVVESLKVVTAHGSERIAKFAFDYARQNNRSKVTAIHKANIMKLGDGLFLKSCEDMGKLYSQIAFDSMIVDNCAMQIVAKPHQFDVMVMPNLYGNIISNIGAGLIGGPGVCAGANIGTDIALFEPGARHVARDIQGRNLANPIAMLTSATMMLRHIGLSSYADNIDNAIYKVVADGKIRTRCMGGNSSSTDFVLGLIAELR